MNKYVIYKHEDFHGTSAVKIYKSKIYAIKELKKLNSKNKSEFIKYYIKDCSSMSDDDLCMSMLNSWIWGS